MTILDILKSIEPSDRDALAYAQEYEQTWSITIEPGVFLGVNVVPKTVEILDEQGCYTLWRKQ